MLANASNRTLNASRGYTDARLPIVHGRNKYW